MRSLVRMACGEGHGIQPKEIVGYFSRFPLYGWGDQGLGSPDKGTTGPSVSSGCGAPNLNS